MEMYIHFTALTMFSGYVYTNPSETCKNRLIQNIWRETLNKEFTPLLSVSRLICAEDDLK